MHRLLAITALFLFIGLASAADKPPRSGEDKVKAQKALQAVKKFTGEDGKALPEITIIEVGMIDRLSVDEAENLTKVAEVLLTHMLPDKPTDTARSAAISLHAILNENTPTGNDTPAIQAHRVLVRQWRGHVLFNKALREFPRIEELMVSK